MGDKVADLKHQLARALADYDNLRKRSERETRGMYSLVSAKVIVRLLPVYDMLEEAQAHLSDSGLAIAIVGFEQALREEGVQQIVVKKGDKFDSDLHEAVKVTQKSAKEGVVSIEQSGWKFVDGTVIRHVKVGVVKKRKK